MEEGQSSDSVRGSSDCELPCIVRNEKRREAEVELGVMRALPWSTLS